MTAGEIIVCVNPRSLVSPNLVSCPESDPLRDRSVLLGLLGQDPLDLESLLRRLHKQVTE